MRTVIVAVLALVSGLGCNANYGQEDLATQIGKAKQRIQLEFITKLWYAASEAITDTQDGVLKIYTQYTVQQAQHVVDHISIHQNLTKNEGSNKRSQAFQTKNLEKLVSTLDCMFKAEGNTLRSYKLTGYNLHDCIRMAQNELETKYLEIVANLENIKNISIIAYNHYQRNIDNCVQSSCVMSQLFQSIVDYERLREDVASNVTEVGTLSTRYVFNHIAMGCVSNSLTQISENYEIGRNLVDSCLTQSDDSATPTSITEMPEPETI